MQLDSCYPANAVLKVKAPDQVESVFIMFIVFGRELAGVLLFITLRSDVDCILYETPPVDRPELIFLVNIRCPI